MLKQIWNNTGTALSTGDREGLGRIRFEDTGNVFRWVKNICKTDLEIHAAPDHPLNALGVNALKYVSCTTASLVTGAGTVVVGDGLVVTGLAGTVKQAAGANDEFVGWAMQSQDTSGNSCLVMLCLGR